MKISELAKKSGTSVRSLRYYEQKNLIHPSRSENGYREYDEYDFEKVKDIQLLLKLGVSTDEISNFISCDNFESVKNPKCAESAIELYSCRLKSVREQLKRLKESETHLENLLNYWKIKKEDIEGRD